MAAINSPIIVKVDVAEHGIAQNITQNVNVFPVSAEDRRSLLILMEKVKQFWVEGVLDKSVHQEARLALGREMRPEDVRQPWARVLELPEQQNQTVPPDMSLGAVFDALGHSLLILGEPGSGKTITLLDLARELITRTEADAGQPIPVVFNLSSWASRRLSLKEWLIGELSAKYFIPRRAGGPWLDQNRLLLLLDGLDEVRAEHRAVCVEAINAFVQECGVPGLVVCCRLQEYQALAAHHRLILSGAICLHPLTSEQVSAYVVQAGPPLASLNAALQGDPALQELARTPLMLSLMSVAYQGQSADAGALGGSDAPEARRAHLFDLYIQAMFRRKGNAALPYPQEQTTAWLSWLAEGMQRHSQTEFLIEQLQPIWLLSRRERAWYRFGSRFIAVAAFGLLENLFLEMGRIQVGAELARHSLGWLLSALIFGVIGISPLGRLGGMGEPKKAFATVQVTLSVGLYMTLATLITYSLYDLHPRENLNASLAYGFLLGLFFGLRNRGRTVDREIQPVEALHWSWRKALRPALWGLASGVALGLFLLLYVVYIIFSRHHGHAVGTSRILVAAALPRYALASLGAGLLVGLPIGAVSGLLGGFSGALRQEKSFPNQGISLSIKSSLLAGLAVSGLTLTIQALTQILASGWAKTDLSGSLRFSILVGLIYSLWYGGLDAIQHYWLRWLLWRQGNMPGRYAHFLDYAAKLIFLQKVGGGYIFVHRLLLEYFAEMRPPAPPAS